MVVEVLWWDDDDGGGDNVVVDEFLDFLWIFL